MEAETSLKLVNPLSLLLASLGYSYFFLAKIPNGILRLMFLLPVIYIFSIVPWYFPSALLRGVLSFFITWIASSKLLLFCFNQGPLLHCQTFLDFLVVSILPLKIKHKPTNSNVSSKSQRSLIRSALDIDPRYEVVQLLNKPYLATSLQDFWGRRWNRYSSNILRDTVYNPARNVLNRIVGVGAARILALICSLVVSGVLHEMMFYYITCGKKPTWEVTCYFVLQGLAMASEAALKKVALLKGWSLHPLCSIISTCGFVLLTFYWLLVLPVWRDGKSSCDKLLL